MRRVCFVTGTRAEYGLLSRLMRMIADDQALELQIIATNMHLSPEFGLTVREIEADGFVISRKVEMLLSADTPSAISKSLGVELIGLADAYRDLQPDLLVLLGDRYEMLGAVASALFFRIPVAHISGGDVTEGAYDDAIRHAVTKMSHLHFTATEVYRNRVIQLGEEPDKVYNVGSLGIDNIHYLSLLDKQTFSESTGFTFGPQNLLVTFHPATLDPGDAGEQFSALLEALDDTDAHIIFTKPNSDSCGRILASMIDEYVGRNSDRAVSFTSMGHLRYLSALQFMDVVVGNSSSGIVEAPSFHIPTVNIGDRQKGRIQASGIINCPPEKDAIRSALAKAFSPEFRNLAAVSVNPYEQPGTARKIYEIIRNHPLEGITQKRFYDK